MTFKKTIRTILISFILLFLALGLAMYIAGNNIGAIIEKQINDNIQTSCTIGDAEMSIFKNWPFVFSSLHNLEITGSTGLEKTALIKIADVELELGFWNALRFGLGNSDVLTIRKMDFNNALINLEIDSNGTENWDIIRDSDDDAVFSFKLQNYSALNSSINYTDKELGLEAHLRNIEHRGSGQLGSDIYNIKTNTIADSLNLIYQELVLLKDAHVELTMPCVIDWKINKFSLDSSKIGLNNFDIYALGDIDFLENHTGLNLKFGHGEFEDLYGLLSIIPAFNEQYSEIEASSNFKFNGIINGIYSSTSMPLYHFDMELADGEISLATVGTKLKNLSAKATLQNTDSISGRIDLLVEDLKFESDGDPFMANLSILNIESDPDFSIDAKGSLDLAYWLELFTIENAYNIDGRIKGGMISHGKISDLQNGNYQNVNINGKLTSNNMIIASPNLPAVQFSIVDAEFDNLEFELLEFNAKSGVSNLSGYGSVIEPLKYLLEDNGILKSTMFLRSDTFNVNEFYDFSNGNSDDSGSIAFPPDLEIQLFLKARKVFYDNLDIDFLNGEVLLSSSKLFLDNVNFASCGGKLSLNGTYEGPGDTSTANFNLDFSVIDISISEATRLFESSASLAPILNYLNGRLSSALRFDGNLNGEMFPVLESINGGGLVNIPNAKVLGFEPLLAIANYLKVSELKSLNVAGMKLSFELDNGRMIVYPFELKYKNIILNIEGWHALNGSMDYKLGITLPRHYIETHTDLLKRIESQAQKSGLDVSKLDTIFLDLQLNGTMSQPKVLANLDDVAQSAFQGLKKSGVEKAQEERDKIRKRSQQIADSIINENKKKLDSIKLAQQNILDSIKNASKRKLDSIRKVKEEEAKEALRKKLEKLLQKK